MEMGSFIKNFNERYIDLAYKTANKKLSFERRIVNWAFGLIGETGEFIDVLKKILFHNHSIESNKDKLEKELGDVFWYTAAICKEFNISVFNTRDFSISKNPTTSKDFNIISLVVGLDDKRKELTDQIFSFSLKESTLNSYRLHSLVYCIIYILYSICLNLNIDPNTVLEKNIKKLSERYQGEFSTKKSLERKENGQI